MARRKKINWKGLLTAGLSVLLIAGAVMGVTSLFSKDTRTISGISFSVGALNDQGQVQKYDQAIISDYFECQGLTIEPDDNATGAYQVFYYTDNKNFVGKTDKFEPADGIYKKGDTYPIAKYARVMITPSVPVDEYGIEESFKIHFYEVAKYADEYRITVDKKQKFKYSPERDLMNSAEMKTGKTYMPVLNDHWSAKKDVLFDAEGKHCSEPIELSDSVTEVFVRCLNSVDDKTVYTNIYFFDEEGDVVTHSVFTFEPGTTELYRTISTNGAKYFAVEGCYWHEWSVFVEK